MTTPLAGSSKDGQYFCAFVSLRDVVSLATVLVLMGCDDGFCER